METLKRSDKVQVRTGGLGSSKFRCFLSPLCLYPVLDLLVQSKESGQLALSAAVRAAAFKGTPQKLPVVSVVTLDTWRPMTFSRVYAANPWYQLIFGSDLIQDEFCDRERACVGVYGCMYIVLSRVLYAPAARLIQHLTEEKELLVYVLRYEAGSAPTLKEGRAGGC